ncbi:MAG: D-alanyl-D-alanine carboxypeptidase [Candidatus Obscuribacter sp.]|nr:D-alanyl-D-alanine carboxypeptidase [Candidatus Obscuribacter sp.]
MSRAVLLSLVVALSCSILGLEARPGGTVQKKKTAASRSPVAGTATKSVQASPDSALEKNIRAWLERPEIRHSRVGVEVMDLASGQVLFQSNGNKRHTPASTAKILTTACLYDLVGKDFVYKTRLLTNGSVKEDLLNGDLAIETSEDPSFSRGDLASLILSLRNFDGGKSGIRLNGIRGKIYQLSPAGSADNFHVHWLLEDFGQEWMPVSSSLVVDKNIAFTGGIPSTMKIEDGETGVNANLNAVLDGVLAADLASAFLLFDEKTQTVKLFRGLAIGPNGKHDAKVHKDGPFVVGNPTAFNMALFMNALSESGLNFEHKIYKGEKIPGFLAKQPAQVMAEHSSKGLPQLIRLCLYESDNLYAQQFLRTIAGTRSDGQGHLSKNAKQAQSTMTLEDRGLARMGEWLSAIAVPNAEVVLFDGCGLSRKNSITPHALNLVLRYMQKKHPEYIELMRVSDSKGGGRFHFKTGAMETVRGLSGVLETFEGRKLAVTALVNGHTASVKDVRMVLGDLIERLRRLPLPAPPAAAAPTKVSVPEKQ